MFLLFTFGRLAVATIIPIKELSLTARVLCRPTKHRWKCSTSAGSYRSPQPSGSRRALGQIVTWVGGPSRALLQTAENGELPPWFSKTNK